MSVDKTQPVNFEVLEITPGDKKGFVKISARFFNSEKVYDYYRKVKSELFFGYEEIGEKPFSFLMATTEKALLDLFYLFPIYYDTEHYDLIRASLAELMGVGVGLVSVKGNTNEQMDDVGAGKGVVVHAVALLA